MMVLSTNTLILEKKAVELRTLGNLGHLKMRWALYKDAGTLAIKISSLLLE